MLSGVVQQVGSLTELDNNRANLFVAGFIGPPGQCRFTCAVPVSCMPLAPDRPAAFGESRTATSSSLDQRQRRELFRRRRLDALDRREQEVGASPPGLAQRLPDRRQFERLGDLDVIESDHGEILGDAERRLGQKPSFRALDAMVVGL